MRGVCGGELVLPTGERGNGVPPVGALLGSNLMVGLRGWSPRGDSEGILKKVRLLMGRHERAESEGSRAKWW